MQSQSSNSPSNVSSSESLQVLNNNAGFEYGIKSALAPIPKFIYPDNPASQPVIPYGGDSGYSFLTKFLTMLFSLTNVAKTWESGKRLYYAENKNVDVVADFIFNFLKTGAWLAFIGLISAGLFLIAPYLLVASAALGVCYGSFNIVRHALKAYRAHKGDDMDARNEHLKAIPAQVLSTAINAVGLVLSVDLGINLTNDIANAVKLAEAGQLFPALIALKGVGTAYQALKTLFYTVAISATLGAITSASTWEMNISTLKTLKNCVLHPQQQMRIIKNAFVSKCKALKEFVGRNPIKGVLAVGVIGFEAISVVSKIVTRTIALASTPLLLIGAGLRKSFLFCGSAIIRGIKKIFSAKKGNNLEQNSAVISSVSQNLSTIIMQRQMHESHAKLQAKIQAQINHLATQKSSPKIAAKKALVEGLQDKVGNNATDYNSATDVAELESQARKISPRVYQSFWKTESKTAEVVRLTKEYEVIRKLAA